MKSYKITYKTETGEARNMTFDYRTVTSESIVRQDALNCLFGDYAFKTTPGQITPAECRERIVSIALVPTPRRRIAIPA